MVYGDVLRFDISKPLTILDAARDNYKNKINAFGKRIECFPRFLSVFESDDGKISVKFDIVTVENVDDPKSVIEYVSTVHLNDLTEASIAMPLDKFTTLYAKLFQFYLNGNFALKCDIDELSIFFGDIR